MRRCSSPRPGITPARAGSSRPVGPGQRQVQDHPRSRGEQTEEVLPVWPDGGSPPLARGAVLWYLALGAEVRITPARAGSSAWTAWRSFRTRDHPRSRGEQRAPVLSSFFVSGSPPLARGAGDSKPLRPSRLGITPARAGSRTRSPSVTSTSWDHPRSRGEQRVALSCSGFQRGSPPLARGADMMDCFIISNSGITPARAGSRMMGVPGSSRLWDHPRSRGEQWNPSTTRMMSIGSPPLARGAVKDRLPEPWKTGITPARAGSRLA